MTYFVSISSRVESSLCLEQNIAFLGYSSVMAGTCNGVTMANRASWAAPFTIWPGSNFKFPLTCIVCIWEDDVISIIVSHRLQCNLCKVISLRLTKKPAELSKRQRILQLKLRLTSAGVSSTRFFCSSVQQASSAHPEEYKPTEHCVSATCYFFQQI